MPEHLVSRIIDTTGLTIDDLIKMIVKKEITLNNLSAKIRHSVIKSMLDAEKEI